MNILSFLCSTCQIHPCCCVCNVVDSVKYKEPIVNQTYRRQLLSRKFIGNYIATRNEELTVYSYKEQEIGCVYLYFVRMCMHVHTRTHARVCVCVCVFVCVCVCCKLVESTNYLPTKYLWGG